MKTPERWGIKAIRFDFINDQNEEDNFWVIGNHNSRTATSIFFAETRLEWGTDYSESRVRITKEEAQAIVHDGAGFDHRNKVATDFELALPGASPIGIF